MPRNLHADVVTALSGSHLNWIALVEIVFDSVTLRLCNKLAAIVYASNTYTGLGSIGSIGSVSENINLDPETCKVSLSGIDTIALTAMVNNDHLGRSISVKYALLDDNNEIVGEPLTYFDGLMSSLEVSYGKTSAVDIDAADQLADWDRIKAGRLTDEDQQALYPGDRCLSFIPLLASKEIVWPDAGRR